MKTPKYLFLLLVVVLIGCKADRADLKYEKNFLKGLKIAKEVQKPLFIHFTGHSSRGRDEFNEYLITSQKIQDKLNDEFLTLQLYVDDATKLQKKDSTGLNKILFSDEGKKRLRKMRNIGNLNNALQIELSQTNHQPLYMIVDNEGRVIGEPFGYTEKNKKVFLQKLNEGLVIYRSEIKE